MKNSSKILLSALMSVCLLFSGCNENKTEISVASIDVTPLYDWGKITGKTIEIWGDVDDLSRPYITRAFKNYEEATGNTIITVPLTKDEINVALPNTFSKDEVKKPDILLNYGGTNLDALKPDDNFYDFTNAPWVDDLTDTSLNQAIYNSKVVGLPHGEASVSGTLYNKEIFKKYNIKIPKTQAEFLTACNTLLQNGITPLYLPYADITMLLYQFPMDSIFVDNDILNSLNNGEITYSQIPEMLKIIDWYKTMADKGYLGSDYEQNNWAGMDNAMKNGKYAMMLCWDTWIYTNFTGDPTTLGIMPAFVGVPENGTFEGANVILALVNKKSDNLEASLDLISFLADPCNYNKTFAGLYAAPIFKNQFGNITTPQYMESEILINQLFHDSIVWSRIKGFSQIDAIYIQKYMQGEYSSSECLAAMDAARLERAGS